MPTTTLNLTSSFATSSTTSAVYSLTSSSRYYSSSTPHTDEELLEQVERGEIQPHNLEKVLPDDLVRAVGIRRYLHVFIFYAFLN